MINPIVRSALRSRTGLRMVSDARGQVLVRNERDETIAMMMSALGYQSLDTARKLVHADYLEKQVKLALGCLEHGNCSRQSVDQAKRFLSDAIEKLREG